MWPFHLKLPFLEPSELTECWTFFSVFKNIFWCLTVQLQFLEDPWIWSQIHPTPQISWVYSLVPFIPWEFLKFETGTHDFSVICSHFRFRIRDVENKNDPRIPEGYDHKDFFLFSTYIFVNEIYLDFDWFFFSQRNACKICPMNGGLAHWMGNYRYLRRWSGIPTPIHQLQSCQKFSVHGRIRLTIDRYNRLFKHSLRSKKDQFRPPTHWIRQSLIGKILKNIYMGHSTCKSADETHIQDPASWWLAERTAIGDTPTRDIYRVSKKAIQIFSFWNFSWSPGGVSKISETRFEKSAWKY